MFSTDSSKSYKADISDDYFEPWKTFQHALVRQLAFAIASPNLIHHFPAEISLTQDIGFHPINYWKTLFYSYEHRLLQLDQNPTELYTFLSQIKSTRLGLRFETLLWFWLQDDANLHYRLIGHSIQTHQSGKTLGEIDFLVRNLHTNQVEHWEVCLKYYLAEPDLAIQHWIGLNPKDTFLHKLNHLAFKQFQFSDALGYPIEQRYTVIKGQLYLPYKTATSSQDHLPTWLNQQRRLGYWSDTIPTGQWYRLNRQEWLCPDIVETTPTPPYWWSNGLYCAVDQSQFLMLRLTQPSSVFKVQT